MIRRYKKSPSYDGWTPVKDYGESCVDLSHWKPDSQDIRDRLIANSLGSSGVGIYDFKDGKIPDDTNSYYFKALLALRRKDVDITEFEDIRTKLSDDVQKNMKKDEKEAYLKELDARFAEKSETTVSDTSEKTTGE